MEEITKSDTDETISSPLIELPVEASIVFIAYCINKNILRATCSHFHALASRKNKNIFLQPSLQLNQEALDHFVFYFCALNKSNIVDNLLQKGANPHACDNAGTSLIHYAARYGYSNIMGLLLTHSDLAARAMTYDKNSSLYLAMKYDQGIIVNQIRTYCDMHDGDLLCYAAKKGSVNVVQTLLSDNVNANTTNTEGIPPLLCTIQQGHIDITKILISNGAHVNSSIKTKNGTCNSLCLAAYCGFAHITQLLLEHGADITTKSFENTPLHIASEQGHGNIITLLCLHGGDAYAKDNAGNTSIDLAKSPEINRLIKKSCEKPIETKPLILNKDIKLDKETLETLTLCHGALGNCALVHKLLSQNVSDNIQDNTSMSLMHYAARYGYLDLANILFKNSEIVSAEFTKNSPLYLAVKYNQHAIIKRILRRYQVNGGQVLCYATQKGLIEIIRTLLACDIDANAVNDKKLPPLWYAIINGGDAYLPIIKLLLDNGAEVNKCIKKNASVDKKFARFTPLHLATRLGHAHTIQLLIDHGADVNVKDKIYQTTPLHLASINGQVQIVKTLLHNNARIDERDINGNTPLISASHNGHLEVVETLINNGANVNATSNKNSTPLYRAATYGHTGIVQLLIAYDADVAIKENSNNDTPLHIAAYGGHVDTVEILLNNDADINAKNNNGYTPLDVAKDDAMRELLIAYGDKKGPELKTVDNENCVMQ